MQVGEIEIWRDDRGWAWRAKSRYHVDHEFGLRTRWGARRAAKWWLKEMKRKEKIND